MFWDFLMLIKAVVLSVYLLSQLVQNKSSVLKILHSFYSVLMQREKEAF